MDKSRYHTFTSLCTKCLPQVQKNDLKMYAVLIVEDQPSFQRGIWFSVPGPVLLTKLTRRSSVRGEPFPNGDRNLIIQKNTIPSLYGFSSSLG